ncbi:hypothetical protein, partial [Trichormus variabilis]|uniref:hypothetical protein n=1 Tax=Anabaena variabilis TaxID=264691 RepID=UPI001CCAE7C5
MAIFLNPLAKLVTVPALLPAIVQSLFPGPASKLLSKAIPPPSIEPLKLPPRLKMKISLDAPPMRVPIPEKVLIPAPLVSVPELNPVIVQTLAQSPACKAFSPVPPSKVCVASQGVSSSSSSRSGSCSSGSGFSAFVGRGGMGGGGSGRGGIGIGIGIGGIGIGIGIGGIGI